MMSDTSMGGRRNRVLVGRLACVLGLTLTGVGCTRESNLTITVDRYINNAMLANTNDSSGEPLDVDVVLLTSSDLARDVNRDLRVGSGITSDVWFSRHPSSTSPQRFDVPIRQIHRQTLVGSEVPANKQATYRFDELKKKADMPGRCVIYVFPEFIGKGGGRLPVAPAVYDNPQGDIKAFIGVDNGKVSVAPTFGQFIRRD